MQPELHRGFWRGSQEVTAGLPVTPVAPVPSLVPVALEKSAYCTFMQVLQQVLPALASHGVLL